MVRRLLVIGIALSGMQASSASASSHPGSEEQLLAFYGKAAQMTAPGVYAVTRKDGRTLRYAFGASGLEYDIKELRSQLDLAWARPALDVDAVAAIEKQISRLEAESTKLGTLQTAQSKAIDTSGICNRGAAFEAHWIDGWTKAAAFARTSVDLDLFGPPAPSTYIHRLYANSWKVSPQGDLLASDVKSLDVLGNGGGQIQSNVTAGFGESCTLHAFSAIYVEFNGVPSEFCPTDYYRSLSESGPCSSF